MLTRRMAMRGGGEEERLPGQESRKRARASACASVGTSAGVPSIAG